MILTHLLSHGLIYLLIGIGYLFLLMISINPRIWGYSDYSDSIKRMVPEQTKNEKAIALIVGIPWILFIFIFPIYSTFVLKNNLGGEFSISMAFINIFILLFLFNLADVIILDWLIVSKITPKFVIIEGTQKEDYKDFSHHYKAHKKSIVIQFIISLILAVVISVL